MMPIGDPRDGFFYSTLTLMMDSCISSPNCGQTVNRGYEQKTLAGKEFTSIGIFIQKRNLHLNILILRITKTRIW